MSVTITINGENGQEAARELKMLADGLAIMGLIQQRALTAQAQSGSAEKPATEIAQTMEDKNVVKKTAEEVEPAVEPAKEEKPKSKRGRKSKAEKEAEAAEKATKEAKAEDKADANPEPYQLFDEDGKEEELFDEAEQFKTALKSMMTDAPDDMTLVAVAKTNESTMQRLQAEDVDFDDVIKLYKTRREEFAEATKEAKAEDKAEEPAQEETKPEKKAEPAEDGDAPSLEDVKTAIKSLSAAKGVKTCLATMQEFGATKASEVKTEDRAKFIEAAVKAAE